MNKSFFLSLPVIGSDTCTLWSCSQAQVCSNPFTASCEVPKQLLFFAAFPPPVLETAPLVCHNFLFTLTANILAFPFFHAVIWRWMMMMMMMIKHQGLCQPTQAMLPLSPVVCPGGRRGKEQSAHLRFGL